jgi:MFS family permease
VFVSTDQHRSQSPTSITLPLRTAWLVLAVVIIADIMDLIDSSIANLAGPSIRAELGGGQVTVQWVLSAYTAAFALALFVISERHSQHPVITPSLFRKRSFVVGLVIVAGFFASLSAFVLVINLLLQLGMRWTPLQTGLTLVPWALGTAVAVLLSGAVLAEKLGRASLHLGLSIAVIGLLALWWSIAHWGADITVWKLAPALLLTGFGSGLVFVPMIDFILGDATTEEVGTGAGMVNAVQQFAGAIGVAALGTVFFARVGHPTAGSYFAAAELVFGIAAGLYFLTLLLVGLLPRHAATATP